MMTTTFQNTLPEAGKMHRITFATCPSIPVWVFRPTLETNKHKVIVAVHGISRNSVQQIQAYSNLAEKHGLWLLAPEFSEDSYPHYQRIAKTPSSARSDLALNRLLLAFRTQRNISNLKIHLCGYSGGAQFAHRYALLHPYNVASLTLVSAGWYTYPNHQQRFPRGLDHWPLWLGKLRLQEFLKLPILVMVGSKDTIRDKSFRTSIRLDQDQGINRVQRAETWVNATNLAKEQHHLSADITLHLMSEQRHDFHKNATRSDMLTRIDQFWLHHQEENT